MYSTPFILWCSFVIISGACIIIWGALNIMCGSWSIIYICGSFNILCSRHIIISCTSYIIYGKFVIICCTTGERSVLCSELRALYSVDFVTRGLIFTRQVIVISYLYTTVDEHNTVTLQIKQPYMVYFCLYENDQNLWWSFST